MQLRTAHVEREGVPVRGRSGKLLAMIWRERTYENVRVPLAERIAHTIIAAYGAGRRAALDDLDADRRDLAAWNDRLERLEVDLDERSAQLDKIEMLAHDALSALSATMVDKRA